MGIATHLGPWLLGTTRYTTGTDAATTRNTGATIVSQDKAVVYNDAGATTAFCIPAGSRIQGVDLNLLQAPTTITTGLITFSINGTAIGTVSVGAGLGNGTMTFATTLAGLRLVAYVGNTDAVLTAALSGTGITGGLLAEFSVDYTVRNIDGSITLAGQGLSQ